MLTLVVFLSETDVERIASLKVEVSMEELLARFIKLAAENSRVFWFLFLSALIALPMVAVQSSFFNIDTDGERRAVLLTSFVVSLVLVCSLAKVAGMFSSWWRTRRRRPNEQSPWRSEADD